MSQPQYIDLETAGQRFPRKKSAKAVKNLVQRGIGGIRLRAVSDGYRYFTTQEWIDQYLTEQSRKRLGQQPEPRAVSWDQVIGCL